MTLTLAKMLPVSFLFSSGGGRAGGSAASRESRGAAGMAGSSAHARVEWWVNAVLKKEGSIQP